MTGRHFWEDPYAPQLDAHDTVCPGKRHRAGSHDLLFAFSGGQESDAGTIGGRPVIDARVIGDRIVCTLPDAHGLQVGEPVRIDIDWEHRYRLMRLHFAAELVLEVGCAALPGVERIGAHIAQDKARIDFAWPESVAERLLAISERVAAIVTVDLPVRSAFSDRAAGRRFWEVEGVARVPCGDTHLRRTGETLRLQKIT